MNIAVRPLQLKRCLAFALVIIASGLAQTANLVEAISATLPLQSSSNSKKTSQRNESDETDVTRPRRAAQQVNSEQSSSALGPIIRVALMTDVESVAVTCTSGLTVRSQPNTAAREISSGSLSVKLGKQFDQTTHQRRATTAYRVSVGSSTESKHARKVMDQLKKKYFEAPELSFDEKHKNYSVLIGRFTDRAEATQFLERLRRAGYEDPKVIVDPTAKDSKSSSQSSSHSKKTDSAAKGISKETRTSALKIIAVDDDRIVAASADEMAIAPDSHTRSDTEHKISSEREDIKKRAQSDRTQDGSSSESDSTAPPLRIGNVQYRGQLFIVLNSRGRLNIVNALPLEEYLRGVVPLELSPGQYPEIEALKAQAVAARSYALAHLGSHRDEGYDLVDDTRAQVYGGLSAERALSNRAIEETRGIAVVFPNEDGKLVPIEALYTANCGGRTENNDEVFGGKPLPYLRAVSCAPDAEAIVVRDIVSNRSREPLSGTDGRPLAKEVGILSVLGFALPARLNSAYLNRTADSEEIKSWLTQIARLNRRTPKSLDRSDIVGLSEFAHLLGTALYGDGRAATLLAPADIDYLLGGIRVQQLPREARADVAMLLKEGILRVPSDGVIDGRAATTRAQAIEMMARAAVSRSGNQASDFSSPKSESTSARGQGISESGHASQTVSQASLPASHGSESRSAKQLASTNVSVPGSQILAFKNDIATSVAGGRLLVASQSLDPAPRGSTSRFTTVNTSSSAKLIRNPDSSNRSPNVTSKNSTASLEETRGGSESEVKQPRGLVVTETAWLFRTFSAESHQVDRLTIIGGEKLLYHLNDRGEIDFLEATLAEHSATSDRFSSIAQWQERMTVDDLQQRLARVRVDVGRVDRVEPVSFSSSNRVTEIEVTGDEGHARLRRSQIRTAFGLREYLFVVDRETDSKGRSLAFVFSGRGWGHGVGMCQTGAYGLARDGYSYSAILQKYYTGVTLQRMY